MQYESVDMKADREPYVSNEAERWSALVVASLGSFLTPFMLSSVNIALPAIGQEFETDAVLLSWVATSYLLAAAVSLVPFGKLADIHGRKKVQLWGMGVFALTSFLAGLSWSAESLIFFRVFQGVGIAMIFATCSGRYAEYPDHVRPWFPEDLTGRSSIEERRRSQINDLFSRYVSAEIAQKIVEAFDWAEPKTKQAVALLQGMEAAGKVLVVLGPGDETAARSFSNLPQVMLTAPGRLATYDVLWADTVVFSRETVGGAGGAARYEVAGDDFVREEGDTA